MSSPLQEPEEVAQVMHDAVKYAGAQVQPAIPVELHDAYATRILATHAAAVLTLAYRRARRIREELQVQAKQADAGSRKARTLHARAAGAADVALSLIDAARDCVAAAEQADSLILGHR